MIAIVDYGMGNLRSVQKAFEYLGVDARIGSDRALLADASHIVLPGVGAFADAAEALRRGGLDEELKRQIASGKPFLGICLGMQLLFDRSFEDGEHEGLSLVPGEAVRSKARKIFASISSTAITRLPSRPTAWRRSASTAANLSRPSTATTCSACSSIPKRAVRRDLNC